jgi:hypothetical protein
MMTRFYAVKDAFDPSGDAPVIAFTSQFLFIKNTLSGGFNF